jgi:branched-chain amino acid transport system substrate-binding protein
MSLLLAGCGNSFGGSAQASSTGANIPSTIKIGTLYAKSGSFATSSMPEYQGLEFWAQQVNKNGGITIDGKKAKVKIVAYNDQSDTQTATTLYNQLITKDKVNILVSDFGSVLTSVAIPIAKEHKMVLFDQSGTGTSFFADKSPYIVLTSLQTSGLWPDSLANYITGNNIKKVAILYDSNDFDQSQETTLKTKLAAAGITPVYDKAVPTSTSSYSVLLHNIAATNPDMVVEFGYPNNDLAFLQALHAGSYNFPKVFTIFPGQLPALFKKNLGAQAIANTYTYPTPPIINHSGVNYGMNLSQFESAFKSYSGSAVNFLDVAGYNTGLVIQKTLETTKSLSQTDIRAAANKVSGTITTLDGNFKIDPNSGAQLGEALPVGQWQMQGGQLTMNVLK